MAELTYALRFQGTVVRSGPDGSILRATSFAPACTMAPRIGEHAIVSSFDTVAGAEARLDSELILTGATTFQESGIIEVGKEGDYLRFSTLGTGYLEPDPPGQARRGAAISRIEEGAGRFAGAGGLIIALIALIGSDEVTGHHLGVLTWR
jgi:hypothetical protein